VPERQLDVGRERHAVRCFRGELGGLHEICNRAWNFFRVERARPEKVPSRAAEMLSGRPHWHPANGDSVSYPDCGSLPAIAADGS
jgi:hypothetical protein